MKEKRKKGPIFPKSVILKVLICRFIITPARILQTGEVRAGRYDMIGDQGCDK